MYAPLSFALFSSLPLLTAFVVLPRQQTVCTTSPVSLHIWTLSNAGSPLPAEHLDAQTAGSTLIPIAEAAKKRLLFDTSLKESPLLHGANSIAGGIGKLQEKLSHIDPQHIHESLKDVASSDSIMPQLVESKMGLPQLAHERLSGWSLEIGTTLALLLVTALASMFPSSAAQQLKVDHASNGVSFESAAPIRPNVTAQLKGLIDELEQFKADQLKSNQEFVQLRDEITMLRNQLVQANATETQLRQELSKAEEIKQQFMEQIDFWQTQLLEGMYRCLCFYLQ